MSSRDTCEKEGVERLGVLLFRIHFRFLKQSRGEIVQRVTPGLPFVRQSFRLLKDDVLDAGLRECAVQIAYALMDRGIQPNCSGVKVQETHLLIESGGIGKHAAKRRLHIDVAGAPLNAPTAENVSK